MIKLGSMLYIHFTAVLLFVLCWINRQLGVLAVSYTAVLLHETAHLAAALAIGLKPDRIIFFPFGVNLRLKNRIVCSLAEEIILYVSGPLSNIIMALLALPFAENDGPWRMFYINNIALFTFNILPILPMDGGMILKRILTYAVGSRTAIILQKCVSSVLILILCTAEAYAVYAGKINYSMLFAMLFLTGNLFTNKEKYYTDFMHELMFYKNKENFKYKRARTYIIKNGESLRRLAEHFAPGRYHIVFCQNSEGKIDRLMTEGEVLDEILNGKKI